MPATRHKLLTVIVEAALERPVVEELERAGVSGFTAVEARGVGDRGQRLGDWDQNRNLRIETICDQKTASALAERFLDRWGRNYAIVLWLHDVDVLRSSKFDTSDAPGGDS